MSISVKISTADRFEPLVVNFGTIGDHYFTKNAAIELRNKLQMALNQLSELEIAEEKRAGIDSDVRCWDCSGGMTFKERVFNDGFCIHCNAEIEIDE